MPLLCRLMKNARAECTEKLCAWRYAPICRSVTDDFMGIEGAAGTNHMYANSSNYSTESALRFRPAHLLRGIQRQSRSGSHNPSPIIVNHFTIAPTSGLL